MKTAEEIKTLKVADSIESLEVDIERNFEVIKITTGLLEAEDIVYIVKKLRTNPKVTEIYLTKNQIEGSSILPLIRYLQGNKTVKVLDLSDNNIGVREEDILNISKMLAKNTALEKLKLAYNFITDDGADSLAAYLKDNKTLTHLDLQGNRMGPKGGKVLADLVEKNHVIKKINIAQNRFWSDEDKAVHYLTEDYHTDVLGDLPID